MLSRERFEASECLFDPSLAGQDEARGMSDLIFDCINGSSMDNRKQVRVAVYFGRWVGPEIFCAHSALSAHRAVWWDHDVPGASKQVGSGRQAALS
jgi:hypothetical protein